MLIATPASGSMTHGDMLAALKNDLHEIDLGIDVDWTVYQRGTFDGPKTLHLWLMRAQTYRRWVFQINEEGQGHAFHPGHALDPINFANLLEFKQLICGIVENGYD